MAVGAQPNLSCVPRVLQGSGFKRGPHTAASIHWAGAGEADTCPPTPRSDQPEMRGGEGVQGWRSVFQPLPGNAALTPAESQVVPKVMVFTGRGAALEVHSPPPPPPPTTRGTLAPACRGADDRTRVCVTAARPCLFANLWTVARQAPLPMGILQSRMLQRVAMPISRGIFLIQG